MADRAPTRRSGVTGLPLETRRLRLMPLETLTGRLLIEHPKLAFDRLGVAGAPGWPSAEELDLFGKLPLDAAPFGPWLVILPADAVVIGSAGFTGPPGADAAVELGFGIVQAFRNRGYASEAARALADWALDQRHVSAITARCAPTNTASVRVLERAGMHRAGHDNELVWFTRSRSS